MKNRGIKVLNRKEIAYNMDSYIHLFFTRRYTQKGHFSSTKGHIQEKDVGTVKKKFTAPLLHMLNKILVKVRH